MEEICALKLNATKVNRKARELRGNTEALATVTGIVDGQ
ncbi:hypothetical protein DICVIV_14354 [Dictyocaulus viviparus]|uniref:Uncharacterized protein n=1 Tax=Dictyocaulus viviparus TaxID=29172 RepID=A0A0D8X5K8_DICVI|nr:hypothetical protein DICVIV_14354 [Dictyocaulus viviparus]